MEWVTEVQTCSGIESAAVVDQLSGSAVIKCGELQPRQQCLD